MFVGSSNSDRRDLDCLHKVRAIARIAKAWIRELGGNVRKALMTLYMLYTNYRLRMRLLNSISKQDTGQKADAHSTSSKLELHKFYGRE